jgi:Mlc titration factor MtfA (ptsG expression regulator)
MMFERPKMLKQKQPQLFKTLTRFYQQDVLGIEKDIKIRGKSPCPCGSGKRCCMPK